MSKHATRPLLLVVSLLSLAAGCSGTDVTRLDFTFSRVFFSERLRPDLGALTPAQRFHWLVAPRSTVVQPSPAHSGLTDDPDAALRQLFDALVRLPPSSPSDKAG